MITFSFAKEFPMYRGEQDAEKQMKLGFSMGLPGIIPDI